MGMGERGKEGGGLAYAGARTFQVQIRRRLHSTVESAGFERIHCALSKREYMLGYWHDLQRCSKVHFFCVCSLMPLRRTINLMRGLSFLIPPSCIYTANSRIL